MYSGSLARREHRSPSKSGKEPVAQAALRGTGLDLMADRVRPRPPFSKIGIDLGTVPQVIRDHRVDVVELEDWEVLRDLFRRSTGHEGVDEGIQGDPGPCDA